jgi:hypothetical protein
VRLTADVRAHQDLAVEVLGGQLRQGEPEHGEVILSGVRPGIPRSQDRGERLAGLVQIAVQRVEPVPVLVVASRQLLLRMRGQQRRIDVQRDRLRPRPRVPHPRPRLGARRTHPAQPRVVDRLQHPMRRRLRRARPEQAALTPVRVHVRDAITSVSKHHRHIPQHPAGIVRRTPLPRPRQRLRQRAGQPDPVGQLHKQRHPGVRHQPLTVRRHFYRSETSLWLHQLGVLLGRVSRLQQSRFSRPGRTFPRPDLSPLSALRG